SRPFVFSSMEGRACPNENKGNSSSNRMRMMVCFVKNKETGDKGGKEERKREEWKTEKWKMARMEKESLEQQT
ncbi:MAG: hypothetical protein KAF40_05265, partial [Flavihumibacter sp.]|nr:hypothetical protein [Flavihumibacter sp.]